jgi:hypothetical protein
MKIIYDGTADFQEYGAADFKKEDIEGKKVVFPKGEAVEVDDAVGELLLNPEGTVFAGVQFKAAEEDDEALSPEEAKAAKKASSRSSRSVPDNPGATLQQSDDASGPSGATGATSGTSGTAGL